MILTPLQAIDAAAQGGFYYNHGIVTIVAIGYAESSLDTLRDSPPNNDTWKSIDRGWLQLNSHWHSEVSDDCAHDAVCAAKEAFRISNQGMSFGAWSTYGDGGHDKPYYKYMPIARLAYDYWTYKNNATKTMSDQAQQVLDLQAQLARAQSDLAKAQSSLVSEVDLASKLIAASDQATAILVAAKQ